MSRDRPDQAKQELQHAMQKWPRMEEWLRHGFHLQHYWFLAGQIEIALYRGDGPQAWQLVTRYASVLQRSSAADASAADGLVVCPRPERLAAAVASGPRKPQDAQPLLREAEGDARRLERIKVAQSPGMGRIVRAGVAAAKGRTEAAAELLIKAEKDFDAAGMAALLAVARCRAQVCGLDNLYDDTIAWMVEHTIQKPVAILTMLAPWPRSPFSVGG